MWFRIQRTDNLFLSLYCIHTVTFCVYTILLPCVPNSARNTMLFIHKNVLFSHKIKTICWPTNHAILCITDYCKHRKHTYQFYVCSMRVPPDETSHRIWLVKLCTACGKVRVVVAFPSVWRYHLFTDYSSTRRLWAITPIAQSGVLLDLLTEDRR